MKLTATGAGYYKVMKNGVEVSQHTGYHKALEMAVNLEMANPTDDIKVIQNLELRVEHDVATPPEPTPVPPTPPTTPKQFFASTSPYYEGVASKPKHANSDALVSELVRNAKLPGGGFLSCSSYSNGIWEVDANTPLSTVRRVKSGANLSFQVRIPQDFKYALGWDGHGCIIDRASGTITDMWAMGKDAQGFTCKDRGVISIGSDGIMRDTNGDWNSATASHIPLCIRPITKKELEDYVAGKITTAGHMLGIAINQPATYPGFKYPAMSNSDGNNSSQNALFYGQVVRFSQGYVVPTTHPPILRLIAETLKTHGAVIMDVSGAGAAFFAQDPQQFGMTELEMLRPYVGNYIENIGQPGKEWIQWYKLFGGATNSSVFQWTALEAVA